MAWAKEKLAIPEEKKPGDADLPRIYASRAVGLTKQPDTIPIPLHVLRIGDVCIGTMPTEVFCETGLEFRKRSPVKPAFMISLAHGHFGYLPTRRHFELGGYETWIGTSRLEPQASEKMLGWRLACNAYTFNKLTFFETIGKVAALGLKHTVGFNWQKLDPKKPEAIFSEQMSAIERKETKGRLADAGIQLPACYCRKLAEEDACRRLFDFAREMGIETLDGEPPFEAYDMLQKRCDEYQINLAVHNHAKPSPYWEPETLLKIFQGRGRRIGACCDTGHWTRSGLPSVEILAKFQGRVLTFDLKDINEEGFCMPFGTGKGDIHGILKELHRQRFRGVIGIEYGQRSPDGESEIAQCVAFFDKVCEELGDSSSAEPKEIADVNRLGNFWWFAGPRKRGHKLGGIAASNRRSWFRHRAAP